MHRMENKTIWNDYVRSSDILNSLQQTIKERVGKKFQITSIVIILMLGLHLQLRYLQALFTASKNFLT